MKVTYILDFDSTLVGTESLDDLARISMEGLPGSDAQLVELLTLTNQGMGGQLPFDESLRRRVELLKATREHVARLIVDLKEAITESALECEEWFSENADNIYIVSGGFEDYIIPVAAELGIPASHVFANRFTYDDQGSITGYDASSLLSKTRGKVAQVAALGLASPVVMIGDGFTDYEVRAHGQADEFWAFTQHAARPAVVERADRVLTSFEEIEELAETLA